MAKQTINIGTSVNKGDGDPLRTAFTKINENFTELYSGAGLDLSAVDQHIIPAVTDIYDLGSPTHQWRSLYLTGNTMYFDGIPLSITDDGTVYVNGSVLGTPGGVLTWDSISNKPTIPADVSDLTDAGNLLGSVDGLIVTQEGTTTVLAKRDVDSTSEETPGGTVTQTVTVESQIEIDLVNILISKTVTEEVDDGVVTTTNQAGSSLEVDNSGVFVKQFVYPDGPNNDSYFQFRANGGAFIEGVQEDIAGSNYGRVNANIGVVEITTAAGGIEKGWLFDSDGNMYLPAAGDILDSNGDSVLGGGSTISVGNGVGSSVEGVTEILFNGTVTEIEPGLVGVSIEGAGSVQPYLELTNTPLIVQPAVLGTPVTVTVPLTGSGAEFSVVIENTGTTMSYVITTAGTGYVVGQIYKIFYYQIGGSDASGDITFTISEVNETGGIVAIDTVLWTGPNNDGTYDFVSISYVPTQQVDSIDTGLALVRDLNQGIYNIELEQEYDNSTHLSPLGTEWNSEGWGNLLELGTRSYTTWRQSLNNAVGNNIVASELVMHDTVNDKYYKFDFHTWGGSNGGYSYTRTEVTDPNYFRKPHNAENDAVDIIEDDSTLQIGITRTDSTGIYNPFTEEGFSNATSPAGTTWNADGWDDLSDLTTRTYTNFDAAAGGYNSVLGKKFVMYVASIQKYYAIQFYEWATNGDNNFAYVRYEIDQTKVNEGITFADGTVLKSAAGVGRVKSTAAGNRRIEEVTGYNQVSVTSRVTNDYTGISARTTTTNYEIFVERTLELDAILQPIWDNGGGEISISFDNMTFTPSFLASIQAEEYWFYYNNYNNYVPQTQGDNVYIRITSGAEPVTWWDKADLPGGSQDFRGAVIDYHAYTGESTIIGSIHIIDDSGEEHISHQEVQSGSTDGENDDLWLVTTEGQIRYRRIDGESKTLKIHWTAKVFYGSELYD